jgi:hypothetical protein
MEEQGFFSQVGEAAQPLILGEKYTVYLQKEKKKLDVNSIFGENCMILKNFPLGKQPYTGPAIEGKKALKRFICNRVWGGGKLGKIRNCRVSDNNY